MHVTLIGMPGSGKSAVGRIVAAQLGLRFLDSDKVIEERQGRPLQQVLDLMGEEPFRRLEEETVLSLELDEPTLIATGGSVIYSEPAMRHLAARTTVVFLDVPFAQIKSHIEAEAPRGIVGLGDGGLEQLMADRLPLYLRYTDLAVILGSEGPEEAAARVVAQLSRGCQMEED